MPFQIIRADITTVTADVIVNSASQMPVIGRGSDWAIYDAAGRAQLYLARKQLGEIAPGEVGVTPAYHLPARYVFHTVAPFWEGGTEGEEEILRACYRNCLAKAVEKKAESIAFPLLSTGSCGIPKELGLSVALSEIGSFLLKQDMLVYLVVFDRTAFALSLKLQKDVQQYIDDHMAAALHQKEHAPSNFDMQTSGWHQSGTSKYDKPKSGPPTSGRPQSNTPRPKSGSPTSDRPQPNAPSYSRPPQSYAAPDALPKAKRRRRPGLPNIGSLLPSGKSPARPSLRPDKDLFEDFSLSDSFPDSLPDSFPGAQPSSLPDAQSNSFPGALPDSLPDAQPDSLPDSLPDSASSASSYGTVQDLSSYAYRPSFQEEKEEVQARDEAEEHFSAASMPPPSLDDLLRHPGENFHSMLFRLIDERDLTNAQVYKKANLDRKLFSKIQCSEDYIPRKKTILALAIALRLNLDETMDLLSRAGLSLSPGIKSDLIVQYCIEHEIYNIFEVDALLFQYDQPLLGA